MKVEVTEAIVTNEEGVVATVSLIDDVAVKIDVRQVVGWNDWIEVYECIKKIMLLMEVKND